jgi:hypothetical protein
MPRFAQTASGPDERNDCNELVNGQVLEPTSSSSDQRRTMEVMALSHWLSRMGLQSMGRTDLSCGHFDGWISALVLPSHADRRGEQHILFCPWS